MIMIKVRKIKKGGSVYYYLEKSIRIGNTVRKKREYLGKELPKNVEEIKEDFSREIYAEEWYPVFEKIKRGYAAELRRMPKEAKEKWLETFMVAFTYDTQRIEGSKLSYRDTAQVLLEQTTPKGAQIRDIKEAEEHKKVFYEMLSFQEKLSLQVVLKWHKELFGETKKDLAGKIRD